MASDQEYVTVLKCAVCSKFKDRLCSLQNYRPGLIKGTTNFHTLIFKDHAVMDIHCWMMGLDQTKGEHQ